MGKTLEEKIETMSVTDIFMAWGCREKTCIEGECLKGAKPAKSEKIKNFLKKCFPCEVDTCMENELKTLKKKQVKELKKVKRPKKFFKARKKHHKCVKKTYACESKQEK